MGYYPTKLEIENIINEVKYTRTQNGDVKNDYRVTLSTIIELFVNHRPVQEPSLDDINEAFKFANQLDGKKSEIDGKVVVSEDGMMALLQQFGKNTLLTYLNFRRIDASC